MSMTAKALLIVASHVVGTFSGHDGETSEQICARLRIEMKVHQYSVGMDANGPIAKGVHTPWCCGPDGKEMADGQPMTRIGDQDFYGWDAWRCIPIPPEK